MRHSDWRGTWQLDARSSHVRLQSSREREPIYTAGLKNMLMSRYGMGETDAFFLGKEAMYSVSSGGYISTEAWPTAHIRCAMTSFPDSALCALVSPQCLGSHTRA